MPSDYWNQFLVRNYDMQNIAPPYNPMTHHTDGTPLTPDITPGESSEFHVYFYNNLLYLLLNGATKLVNPSLQHSESDRTLREDIFCKILSREGSFAKTKKQYKIFVRNFWLNEKFERRTQ